MSPTASCQVNSPTAIFRLCFTEKYVVAATVPGRTTILDICCQHNNPDPSDADDPHLRTIEAGRLWDIACHESLIATANEDGAVRLWSADSG